jgi:hypothetical protein
MTPYGTPSDRMTPPAGTAEVGHIATSHLRHSPTGASEEDTPAGLTYNLHAAMSTTMSQRLGSSGRHSQSTATTAFAQACR